MASTRKGKNKMMMQLKYLEAIREMEQGNVVLHFDKKDNKFQFLKMEEGTLFNAETAEVVDWCTVTPKDGFALLIKRKKIDFISIEYAYEGDEKTKIIDFKDEDLIKIKKEHGIDLPALIEKIVK